MGNSLSDIEKEEREQIIDLLCNLDFDNLDLGQRQGSTDYIDFINPNDLGEKVLCLKGKDKFFRNFFVFKARFNFSNNKYFDTFSTFFQRYTDNKLLWHFCGHYGIYLMDTTGGTTNSQFKLVYELLKEGKVKLDKEKCLECKLNFTNNFDCLENIPDSEYPVELELK